MDNDINDIIERLVESGFKSITIEDEDIIIKWKAIKWIKTTAKAKNLTW